MTVIRHEGTILSRARVTGEFRLRSVVRQVM